MRVPLSAVLLAALASCGTAPTPAEPWLPLPFRARWNAEYAGYASTGPFIPLIRPTATNRAVDLPSENEPNLQVRVRLVRMPRSIAQQLIGVGESTRATNRESIDHASPEATTFAGVVPTEAVEAVVDRLLAADSGPGELVARPTLSCQDGVLADFSAYDEVAYVSAYRIFASGVTFVPDPEPRSFQHGLTLTVEPQLRLGGDQLHLRIELRTQYLMQSAQPIEARFDQQRGLRFQVPMQLRQELRATGDLHWDETMLIAGLLAHGSDDVMLVFVDARTQEAPVSNRRPIDER